MTRKEKHAKRKVRAKKRKAIRMAKYVEKIQAVSHLPSHVSLSNRGFDSWEDPNSPTGYSQVCSYEVYGTCESPCNGDC
jgi:hypothetical protein